MASKIATTQYQGVQILDSFLRSYTASKIVDQALQLHGGYGYMRDFLIERLYRDMRIYHIGGGTREIMNEIISRQLDL